MNNLKAQILVGIVVVASLFLLTNPFAFLMLPMMTMLILALFAGAVLLFVALVWGEQCNDERELVHRGSADRIASLLGSALLGGLIVYQAWHHSLDPVLPVILGAMILAKLGARVYYQFNN